MSPYLREDSDFYCLIWLGLAVLGAFYFNFGYLLLTGVITFSLITATLAPVLGLPPVMVFFFLGYLRPARGKIKMTMLSIATVVALFYIIFSFAVPAEWGGGFGLAVWGVGGAFLTAGGFAMIPPIDESTSPGLLDVSQLPYVKKPQEPEPVAETSEETDKPSEEKSESAEEKTES